MISQNVIYTPKAFLRGVKPISNDFAERVIYAEGFSARCTKEVHKQKSLQVDNRYPKSYYLE